VSERAHVQGTEEAAVVGGYQWQAPIGALAHTVDDFDSQDGRTLRFDALFDRLRNPF
jgi:hypothetical protein